MAAAAPDARARSTALVIAASALGTMFEWYDFFVYGTLAGIIGGHFFPAGNAAVSLLITLGTFGVGFGMRPVGAVLFGVLGDRLGAVERGKAVLVNKILVVQFLGGHIDVS